MSITATGLFDMRAAIPHGDRPRIVWVMDWPTLEEIRSLPEAGVHPGGRDGPVFGWPPKLFGDTVRIDPEAHGVRIELADPPAPDLVDYLRDKLAHADDVVCTCPDIDVSTVTEGRWARTLKGLDGRCPIHGGTHVLDGDW